MRGEAYGILEWMRSCLTHCAGLTRSHLDVSFTLSEKPPAGDCLDAEWIFADGARFSWEHSEGCSHATIAFSRSHDSRKLSQRVAFMAAPEALSEAVFF